MRQPLRVCEQTSHTIHQIPSVWTRRALIGGGIAALMGGPWIAYEQYRRIQIERKIHFLRAALEDAHISISERMHEGTADRVVLLVRLSPTQRSAAWQQETMERLTWLHKKLRDAYGTNPSILLEAQTYQAMDSFEGMSLDSIDFFTRNTQALYGFPRRREKDGEEFLCFDALAAASLPDLAEGKPSEARMPSIVAYGGAVSPDDRTLSDSANAWNREQEQNGSKPLQIMHVDFHQAFSAHSHLVASPPSHEDF